MVFGHFFLKSAMLAHRVGIICRGSAEKLRHYIAGKAGRVQVTLHQHRQRDCRVHISSADVTNEEHNKRQCATNNERVAATGENRQNEEKCTNVLGQVGCIG